MKKITLTQKQKDFIKKWILPTKKGLIKVAIICAVMIAVATIFSVNDFKFGDEYYSIVGSGSMNPIFPTGSVLKYREADIHDVELGDIIVFEIKDDNGRTQKCFHRVIAITHYGENYAARIGTDIILKTKGDWNITMDSWVITPRNFIGIVTSEDYSEFDQRAYFNELEYNGRCAGVTYLKEVDQEAIDTGIAETRERYEIIKNWNNN